MYKVFFNDSKLFLTDNFEKHFQVKYGLFYKYRNVDDLKELIQFYARLKRIESLYVFHSDIEVLRRDFRKCFFQINAAGGLVRNSEGDYLMIFRRGLWDLPKGKLNKNESWEEGAVREVEEECGLSGLKILRPLISTYHTYPYKAEIALKKTRWFEMYYPGNETPSPQLEEGITDVMWISPHDIETYVDKSYPAIQDVFDYFGFSSLFSSRNPL